MRWAWHSTWQIIKVQRDIALTVRVVTNRSHSFYPLTSCALDGNTRLLPQGGTLVSDQPSFRSHLNVIFQNAKLGTDGRWTQEKMTKSGCSSQRSILPVTSKVQKLLHSSISAASSQLNRQVWLVPRLLKKELVNWSCPAPPSHAMVGAEGLGPGA